MATGGDAAHRNSHSRNSSINSVSSRSTGPPTPHTHTHAPQTPSRLRQSHAPGSSPSPESHPHPDFLRANLSSSPPEHAGELHNGNSRSSSPSLEFEEDGIHPRFHNGASTAEDLEATRAQGYVAEQNFHAAATENTRLLQNYNHADCSNCDHGTFSPHAPSFSSPEDADHHRGYDGQDEANERQTAASRLLGPYGGGNFQPQRPKVGRLESWMSWGGNGDARNKSVSTTRWLMDTHGIRGRRRMYISYYIPFMNCEFQSRTEKSADRSQGFLSINWLGLKGISLLL